MDGNFTTPSAEKFLSLMEFLGHKVYRETSIPFNLNIVGFRNLFGRTNYFDDIIAIYYEYQGEWMSVGYQATTRPGLPHLLKPMNSNGAAILVPGQYRSAYSIGKHKGKYDALVQVGDVEVYRDNNQDSVYDSDSRTIDKGYFGINIHRASFGAKLVGPDSAGCQVIKERSDFESFMALCQKAHNYWRTNFTYTLVEL